MNTIDTKTYGRKAEATKKVLGKMAKIALAAGALGAAGYAGREVVQGFRSQGHLNDLLDSSAKGVNASLEGLSKAFKFDKEGYEKSKAEAKNYFEDAKEHGDTLEKIDSNKYQSGALRKVGANIANILNSRKSAIAGNEVNKYGNDPSYLPSEAKNELKDLADGVKGKTNKFSNYIVMKKIIYDYGTKSFSCIELRDFSTPRGREASHARGQQLGRDLASGIVGDSLEAAKAERAATTIQDLERAKANREVNGEHPMASERAAARAKYMKPYEDATIPGTYAKPISSETGLKAGKTSWSDKLRAKVLDAKDAAAEAAYNTKEAARTGVARANRDRISRKIDKFNASRA